jgi:hypothetical protein
VNTETLAEILLSGIIYIVKKFTNYEVMEMLIYQINNKCYTLDEIIDNIIKLNTEIYEFWMDSSGWAPMSVQGLLDKSRLDWQICLTKKLIDWNRDFEDEDVANLILAWVNLGCLVEGTLKLALSIFYEDYLKDDDKYILKNKVLSPDGLELERLRKFANGRLWKKEDKWDDWILHIQQRRNTVHAYKDRELGSFDEFYNDLSIYYEFLMVMKSRFPY